MSKGQKIVKRILDIIFSILLIIILIVPLFFLVIIASVDTKLSGIFYQERIGQYARTFTIYKIRTLNKEGKSSKFGQFLRQSKVDEFMQIFNVLKGDMSFVGPRPDIKGFADELVGEDRIILTVKPGITGPASIEFKSEEELLKSHPNPEEYNREYIWKEKVKINKAYVNNYSLIKDMTYIFRTFF